MRSQVIVRFDTTYLFTIIYTVLMIEMRNNYCINFTFFLYFERKTAFRTSYKVEALNFSSIHICFEPAMQYLYCLRTTKRTKGGECNG